ncbi:MAG: ABC transporter permease [Pirellulaceae bacterium]
MSDAPMHSSSKATSLMGDGPSGYALEHRMLETPKKSWEKWWVWASERANPIVVKEVRQSLKSRQFSISFGFTLLAAVGWTILSISLGVPRILYVPGGALLLTGYFAILIFPLMVIIPFSAFRSLTTETEDSTFELLSISALSATQIVHGKMASAMVQIMLYLSALAPCIVLTYLLRGVSLFTILVLLGLTLTFSICETALALLFAAVGRTRMVQNLVSVLVLAGLLFAAFGWISALFSGVMDEIDRLPDESHLIFFALATIVTTAVSLVLHAAAAAIDFPAENHSTRLRLRVIGLATLVFFWSLLGAVAIREPEALLFMITSIFIFMLAVGGLITGEYGVISPRAQRTLPKTFFGRIFLTWLFPGSGLGYVFVICLFAGMAASLASLEIYYSMTLKNWFASDSVAICGYLYLCYLAFYLGLNRLLLLCLPQSMPSKMLGSGAMLIVMLVVVHLGPLLAIYYLNDFRNPDYDWHQAFNIPWTVTEVNRNGIAATLSNFSGSLGRGFMLLTLCAVGVFGLNLLLCTRDILLVRVAEPPRVREDKGLSPTETTPKAADPFADV